MSPSIHPPTSKSVADLGTHVWSWGSRAHGLLSKRQPRARTLRSQDLSWREVLQGLAFWNSQAR